MVLSRNGGGQQTVSYRAEGSVPDGALLIKNQAARADLIVRGRIVIVDDARWNSPTGEKWNPDENSLDMPVVYTTFYVEVEKIFKGTPKWGSPVAFRILGGVVGPEGSAAAGSVDAPFPELKAGDEVVLFGKDDSIRYGGVFTPEGYWAMWDSHSMLRNDEGVFVNLGGGESPAEDALVGAALEEMLAAPSSP